ncbi:MAG: MarR family winged helix-turn-helix transcriptional regulator [Gemmatimonadales bacterium]
MFGLIKAGRALEDQLEKGLGAVGLSMPKFTVLSELARSTEPLTLSELAARLACVRSNMTQLVDRLEAEGLVRRTDDPADRRTVRAALTPLGLERSAAGAVEVARIQREFAASIPAGELSALGRALGSLP